MGGAGANWARVGNSPVIIGSLEIPVNGAWVLDAELDGTTTPQGQISVTWGNLTLAGSVVRASAYVGRIKILAVGGAGGWSTAIPAVAYNQPGGVLASTVLGDAARAVGESSVVDADTSLGVYWSRVADKASRTLRKLAVTLADGAWYIDNRGVTHIGARPSNQIKSKFTTIDFQGGAGSIIEIATEDPASWLPGNTFTDATLPGSLQLSSVRHAVSDEGVSRIWAMVN
jgi:hypothetical protein